MLRATLEVIAEHGAGDLRVDDVARRAGVGKATSYRRHRSKDELIAAAVKGLVSEISIPDTGSTSEDVRLLMRGAVRVYRGSLQAGVTPGLVEAMRRDAQIARAVREGFLARRRAQLRKVLERLGISPADVRKVVMTHLHTDHAGGLHHFPHSEIIVSRRELELASGRCGRIRGYVNNRFPDWFAPTPIDLPPTPFGPFPNSLPLTAAGDVVAVALPGHTPGHIGVIVQEEGRHVFIAGDSSYDEQLMLERAVDGVSPDEGAALQTLGRIHELIRATPTVYLVAHDPGSGDRLERRAAAAAVA